MNAAADYFLHYVANSDNPVHMLLKEKERLAGVLATGDLGYPDGVIARFGNDTMYTTAGYLLHLAEEYEKSQIPHEYQVMRKTMERIKSIHQNPRYRSSVFGPLDNPRMTDEEFQAWAFQEAVKEGFGQSLEEVLGEAIGAPIEGGKAVVDVAI